MASHGVTVMARIKAKKGMEKKVKEGLLSLLGPTRLEKGCINYELHQSADDPGLFMFYENWKDMKCLDKHLEMPYIKAFMDGMKKALARPVQVTLWVMVSPRRDRKRK
jgi:quinol monooxygenase YgiN